MRLGTTKYSEPNRSTPESTPMMGWSTYTLALWVQDTGTTGISFSRGSRAEVPTAIPASSVKSSIIRKPISFCRMKLRWGQWKITSKDCSMAPNREEPLQMKPPRPIRKKRPLWRLSDSRPESAWARPLSSGTMASTVW